MKKLALILIVALFPVFAHASVNVGAFNTAGTQSFLPSGLVGYWTMDQNDFTYSNGSVLDRSGSGNNGTATAYTGATSTMFRSGAIGSAINFNGSSQFIDVASTTAYGFERTNSFSGSAWINMASSTATQIIFGKRQNSNSTGWAFAVFNKKIELVLTNAGGTNQLIADGTLAMSANQWYHVVFTYNGNSSTTGVNFYINGVSDAVNSTSNNLTLTIINTADFTIGKQTINSPNTFFYGGNIDDVRLYNRVITPTEVQQLYTASKTSVGANMCKFMNAGLLSCYTLDSNDFNFTAGTFLDRGSLGNTLFARGYTSATSTMFGKGVTGSSLSSKVAGQFATSTDAGLPTAATARTINQWIYPTSFNSGYNISFFYGGGVGGGVNYQNIYFGLKSTGKPFIETNNIGCTTTAPPVPINTWTMLTFAAATPSHMSDYTMYVNGVATANGCVDSTTGPLNTVLNGTMELFDNNANDFIGRLDNTRIYNRRLSASEIANLYQAELGTKIDSSNCSFIPTGLVGCWTMDGSDINYANGTIRDRSVSGNTGTFTAYTNATTTMLGTGKTGSAVNFNGTSNNIKITDTNNVYAFTASTSLSLCGWANTSTVSQDGNIAGRNTDSLGNFLIRFEQSGGVLKAKGVIQGATTGSTALLSTTALSVGSWYHVCIVYTVTGVVGSNPSATLFLNGVGETSSGGLAIAGNLYNSSNFWIGSRSQAGGDTFFKGKIDTVRVYNRAITATEVMQLYKAGL